MTPFLDEHVAAIEGGDLETVLAHYRADAVFLQVGGVTARGIAEIREFFAGYLARRPRVVKLLAAAEGDGIVVYDAEIALSDGGFRAVGTLVLRDGLIWRQTAVPVE